MMSDGVSHWLGRDTRLGYYWKFGQQSSVLSSVVLQREGQAEGYHIRDGTFGLKLCGHINQPSVLPVDQKSMFSQEVCSNDWGGCVSDDKNPAKHVSESQI